MRIDSAQLAERMDSVVVEDRFAIDAGAQDLVAFEVTIGTVAASVHFDVVDIQIEHVGAVEVTDGHIPSLTSVGAQVNSILVPSTFSVVAASSHIVTNVTSALGCHRPLLDSGEVGTVVRNSHAEVFSSIAGILSASPEAKRTTESDLR